MLDQERAHFTEHADEWMAEHRGSFVVIKGEALVGFFPTLDDALAAGARAFGLESFLVRQLGVAEEPVSVPALTLGLLGAHP